MISQLKTLSSKKGVLAIIDELEKITPLMKEAAAEEVSLGIAASEAKAKAKAERRAERERVAAEKDAGGKSADKVSSACFPLPAQITLPMAVESSVRSSGLFQCHFDSLAMRRDSLSVHNRAAAIRRSFASNRRVMRRRRRRRRARRRRLLQARRRLTPRLRRPPTASAACSTCCTSRRYCLEQFFACKDLPP